LLAAAGLAAQTTPDPLTYRNPVLQVGPDPWVIFHDGFYYEMNTTGFNLVIRKTHDITELQRAERKVVWRPPHQGPYSHDLWAPELHVVQGKWFIYFAADDGNSEDVRISVESCDPVHTVYAALTCALRAA
jgi:GH43 family beta-xylosidase